jgi:nucleoside-diphosphate-sugar epimerase
VKVLLTGATGFIGSHVARALLHGGHEVHAVVRPTSDRRRIADIERALTIHTGEMDHVPIAPDLLIHLAWYAVPGRYLTAPENRDCLAASARLLRRVACRAVFAGTCFEFDTTLGRLSEDSATKPTTLYAESKDALRREVVARENAAWVRFFYQYGPWEDERRLVPSIMRALLRGEPQKLTPGDQRRDFLHVEDVAAAVCAIATSGLTGPVNVGSGHAPSVKEIAQTIATLAGRPDLLRFGELPYGPGEPMLIQADNATLRSTGWAPRYSLEDGLRHTLAWWRARLT